MKMLYGSVLGGLAGMRVCVCVYVCWLWGDACACACLDTSIHTHTLTFTQRYTHGWVLSIGTKRGRKNYRWRKKPPCRRQCFGLVVRFLKRSEGLRHTHKACVLIVVVPLLGRASVSLFAF